MLLSATELINKSIELYKSNGKLFAMYSALVAAPFFVINLLNLALLGFSTTDTATASGIGVRTSMAIGIASIVAYIIAGALSIWFSVAMLRIINTRLHGQTPKSVREELVEAKPLILPSLGAAILTGLAILFGFLFLIIPGVILAVWFCFVAQAVALQHTKAVDALKYSKSLVTGRWSAIFWRLIAMGVVFLIFSSLPQLLVSAIFSSLKKMSGASVGIQTVWVTLNIIVGFIITSFTAPFGAAGQVVLYEEAKKTLPPQA